jgi:N-acetylmuramic acid 6-phosphate etherase
MKLVLNTVSTGTMVKMGRVSGNWMSYVDVSNKKLLDRGTRLVSELCGLEYHTACIELFKSIEELKSFPEGASRPSPVQHTLSRVNGKIKIPDRLRGRPNVNFQP